MIAISQAGDLSNQKHSTSRLDRHHQPEGVPDAWVGLICSVMRAASCSCICSDPFSATELGLAQQPRGPPQSDPQNQPRCWDDQG